MKRYICLLVAICVTQLLSAQQITKSTYQNVLLKNATVHTVTKGTLSNTDVLIVDGKISSVGTNLSASDAQIIDCTDRHIYPGFIDAGTTLGMSEVGSVSLTNDFNEIGDFIPQMQALTAVNPNAVAIPVTRVNGVTSVIVAPQGGIFPGTASLIDLIGYTPQQMDAGFSAVIMNFPSSGKRGRWDRRTDDEIAKDAEKTNTKINEIWSELTLYHKIDSASNGQSTMQYQRQHDMM
jgi:cytosine/adenosine deaminase-related metal-dependent hydrolase